MISKQINQKEIFKVIQDWQRPKDTPTSLWPSQGRKPQTIFDVQIPMKAKQQYQLIVKIISLVLACGLEMVNSFFKMDGKFFL